MTTNPKDRIEDIDARLKELPKGTLTYKTINGKKQPYIQKSVDGKVTSTYVKLDERERVFLEFEERSRLQEEKKHLLLEKDLAAYGTSGKSRTRRRRSSTTPAYKPMRRSPPDWRRSGSPCPRMSPLASA